MHTEMGSKQVKMSTSVVMEKPLNLELEDLGWCHKLRPLQAPGCPIKALFPTSEGGISCVEIFVKYYAV